MFGITQQPLKIRKLTGPVMSPKGEERRHSYNGNGSRKQLKRKQSRPKVAENKSRKSDQSREPSPNLHKHSNMDLEDEIYDTFGQNQQSVAGTQKQLKSKQYAGGLRSKAIVTHSQTKL